MLKNLLISSLVFVSSITQANYIYEGGQSLIDLTGVTGTTNLNGSDDYLSVPFALDNTFTLYGQDFDSARMATNGCLHFGLPNSGVGYNDYCGDYTPDPLPHTTYTLYAFYTDLIRDSGSKMLGKNFSDKTVFGWYNLREYNRTGSDNSFEVILWTNNTFEYRYGELDIINHDVLIGEQGSASETYTYLFHDECRTGTTNVAGTCVNTNWNGTASNTALENGGSLFGEGAGNALDCSEPLNNINCSGYAAAYLAQQCDLNDLYNESCSGYAAAYLTQQCDITQLYSDTCPNYWDAYDDQQCDEDSQYSPSCPGYEQEASVAYYVEEEFDYGTEEDSCITNPDWCYDDPNTGVELTDEEWYAIDVEEFGQEQVDDWYGTEVVFDDTGTVNWNSTELQTYDDIDEVMDLYDEEIWQQEELSEFQEENVYIAEEEILYEELPTIEEEIWIEQTIFSDNTVEALPEVFIIEEEYVEILEQEQETITEIFDAEDLIELYEFETIIREELVAERIAENEDNETLEEELKEIREELEEESEDLIEEREELLAEEGETKEEKKSSARISALDVVANTIQTARESVSNAVVEITNNAINTTTEEIDETIQSESSFSTQIVFNNTDPVSSVIQSASNTPGSGSNGYVSGVSSGARSVYNSNAQSSSASGTNTTNSPSVSEQFVSSTAQTQQVLSLNFSTSDVNSSSGSTETSTNNSNTFNTNTVSVNIIPTLESSPQIVMAEVQVTNMNNEIDTAVSGVMTASEADQIADQIIAQNIQTQKEQSETEQQETGSYSDETTLVAYLGYVAGFDSYREVKIPQQETWYEARAIYANAVLPDNTQAFYSMAGDSISTLSNMINLQPNL